MKTSSEIRQAFLDYFAARGHEVVASSPLVPGNDPTLLFTNAGMVQFKDVFLGRDKRGYSRAVTAQRCVRAGGKHNDLENVGYTARHHTFFEMLGNFSFGDYFKRDAIKFCWELLTREFGLPPEKLWVTVYEKDQEAEDIWFNEIGIDRTRFSRCGEKDNFWSMGDTGPCGPCSEVFYDHGPEIWGGPPGSPEEDGDRYIEIWNLVFMQYDRSADGTLTPLPRPSVDTGMGLERLAAVLQGVHSNYETDLFKNLIDAAAEVTHAADRDDKSLRVIADHIRSCAFLIVDGVLPDKEGRGYVLRRIMRRAIRHGHRLGMRDPFFYRLVSTLDNEMGDAYPELRARRDIVERVIRTEEERFAETLDNGMRILEESIEALDGKTISGDVAFKLYDTYGFPADLTADIARERSLSVDMEGFDRAMKAQQSRSREEGAFEAASLETLDLDVHTEFDGYETLAEESTIVALRLEGGAVPGLATEERGMVVLDRTPFYAESGGQVGDRGLLTAGQAVFEVEDTRRLGDVIVHIGVVTEGSLKVGDRVSAQVDRAARGATARNHSATHLLHAALREILGTHVTQKGSLVSPERLRFDFSHYEPVTAEQLDSIESLVNEWVQHNDEACTRIMALEDAKKSGAIALFGEKYEDPVRVLSIGDYSTELCGGTHVSRGGDIGLFKVVGESGIAAGTRRIEAVTGMGALRYVQDSERRLRGVANVVRAERDTVGEKIEQLLSRSRELEKDLERLRGRLAASQGEDLAAQAVDIDGIKVLAAQVDGIDPKRLRDTVDQLKNKLGSAAILLATVDQDKVKLVAGVTKDCTDRIKAGPLAKFVAEQVGGGGGGRPEMAEAGGSDPSKLGQAISSVPNWVRAQLTS